MNRTTISLLGLCTGLLITAGCPGDDSPTEETDTVANTSSSTVAETDPGTGSTGNTGNTGSTGSTGVVDDTGSTGEGTGFEFDDSPPEDYTRVDRMGMPAINTAVITSKDDYNAASPTDDANGDFVPEIVTNLTGLHDALDDDLTAAGLTPCIVDDCVAQAAPLVVPDTIKIDLTVDAGFPNGRLPADPVMDVTLAVVLLDLAVAGQDALTLVGTNPTANDVAFSDEFPFFAPPH